MALPFSDSGAGAPAAFRYQWLFQRMRAGRDALRAQSALAMARTRYPEGALPSATQAALDLSPESALPAYRVEGLIGPFVVWSN